MIRDDDVAAILGAAVDEALDERPRAAPAELAALVQNRLRVDVLADLEARERRYRDSGLALDDPIGTLCRTMIVTAARDRLLAALPEVYLAARWDAPTAGPRELVHRCREHLDPHDLATCGDAGLDPIGETVTAWERQAAEDEDEDDGTA